MTSTTMQQKKQKASYYYKLFRVKRSDGRVTTVSLDPALAVRACQYMGGLKAVGKIIREAAMDYEDDKYKSCSGFVAQQLREAVEKASKARATAKLESQEAAMA